MKKYELARKGDKVVIKTTHHVNLVDEYGARIKDFSSYTEIPLSEITALFDE